MRAVADRWRPGEIARAALAASEPLLREGLRRMAAFKRVWSGGRRGHGDAPPYAAHRELATRLAGIG